MILSFGDKNTQRVFLGQPVKKLPENILRRALRKLVIIDSAVTIDDLRSPPGNRLKALSGEWEGFYSIRINDQWRIIFSWDEGYANDVSIIDYH